MRRWNRRDGERPHRRHRQRNRGNQQRRDNQWYGNNSYQNQGRTETQHAPSSSTSSPSTSSSSSSASSSTSAPELPGFYFDPEKNRYFRLLPGHNNCNPLTMEQLRQKEREKQRQKSLAEDENPRKKAPRLGLNIALLQQRRHLGTVSGKSYCRLSHEAKVSGMKRQKVDVLNFDDYNSNTDVFRHMVADSSCERVCSMIDVSPGGVKYSIMNINSSKRGALSMEMRDDLFLPNRKLTAVCWASFFYPDSHILLCLVGGKTPGSVLLLPLDTGPDDSGFMRSFDIATALSCAWCLHPQFERTFSIGLSQKIILKQGASSRSQTYSVSSDVLAQQFSLRSPVLFNGCRSGEIFSLDLRQRDGKGQSWKIHHFRQESAVTSLQILQDDNYLLAADMSGQIKMWDVRMSKSVLQYRGHYNEHVCLPIQVCEPEGLLLAVGQDCYTRMWSLRDGQLLRTVPSPHPAANDLIPSVVFSSNLGGRRGSPGMLMAVKNDMFYFPFNSDYAEIRTQERFDL